MSFQSTIKSQQTLGTIEGKQHTTTNFNTNNSLAFSQTLQENDNIEVARNMYFESKESIQTQKQYQYVPHSEKQIYKRASSNTCSIVLNSLTQKEVGNFINSLQVIKFLTKQTAQKRLLIENKRNGIKKLRNKIKITEDRILLQKQKYVQKAKTFRKRSESVKKTRNSKLKRFNTQITNIKQEISSIKKKLSAPKNQQKHMSYRRSSLRFHTEAIQQKIYIPMPMPVPYPVNANLYHNARQTPCYQQIYQRQLPNPQTLPIFRRTSQQSNQQYQQKTSQRSSNSTKDKLHSSKNVFDIIGEKLKTSGAQNNLFVPFSQTQDLQNDKTMEKSSSIRIKITKNNKSKKSSIFDQSSVKILCEQTNSYSLQSEEPRNSQISKKEEQQMQKSNAVSIYFPSHFIKDFKISNLEESVESKFTQTQRINNLPIAKKKQKTKKSVRFHDSVEDDSELNVDEIVLTSKSKFSKESKYLPSSLQNSRSIEQGSGFGELHLTSQSIVSPMRQTELTKRGRGNSIIKIVQ